MYDGGAFAPYHVCGVIRNIEVKQKVNCFISRDRATMDGCSKQKKTHVQATLNNNNNNNYDNNSNNNNSNKLMNKKSNNLYF